MNYLPSRTPSNEVELMMTTVHKDISNFKLNPKKNLNNRHSEIFLSGNDNLLINYLNVNIETLNDTTK